MGLDWCVNIYKHDDCEYYSLKQVEGDHKEFGYEGETYARGKVIEYILKDYKIPEEICFGEWGKDPEGNKRGPFLTEKCVELIEYFAEKIPYRDLKSETDYNEYTIQEQKECFDEFKKLVNDVREYNEKNNEYYALIWCWY